MALPGEAGTADADAVAHGAAIGEHVVEEAVVGVDDEGARFFRPLELDHLAAELLLDAAVGDDRHGKVDGALGRGQQGRVEELAAAAVSTPAEGVFLVAKGLGEGRAAGEAEGQAGEQQAAARKHQLNPENTKPSRTWLSRLPWASLGRACGSNMAVGLPCSRSLRGEREDGLACLVGVGRGAA